MQHEKPRKCPSCSQRFATSRDLRRHQHSIHEVADRSLYYCLVQGCKKSGRGYDRPDNCKRHISKQHPDIRKPWKEVSEKR